MKKHNLLWVCTCLSVFENVDATRQKGSFHTLSGPHSLVAECMHVIMHNMVCWKYN